MTALRVVVDTNVILSAMMMPASIPGRTLDRVVHSAVLIFNSEMVRELAEVLVRPKFDRYVGIEERKRLLGSLIETSMMVPTISVITTCRDPKDNHVLEAAVNGSADVIVTGDKDLLDLNPFHRIKILTPAEFLAQ